MGAPEENVSAPVGVTEGLQAVRVGESREGYLAQRAALAVGVARKHHTGVIDVETEQLAGRETVLLHAAHGEVRAELRELRESHGEVLHAGTRWRAIRIQGGPAGNVHLDRQYAGVELAIGLGR